MRIYTFLPLAGSITRLLTGYSSTMIWTLKNWLLKRSHSLVTLVRYKCGKWKILINCFHSSRKFSCKHSWDLLSKLISIMCETQILLLHFVSIPCIVYRWEYVILTNIRSQFQNSQGFYYYDYDQIFNSVLPDHSNIYWQVSWSLWMISTWWVMVLSCSRRLTMSSIWHCMTWLYHRVFQLGSELE